MNRIQAELALDYMRESKELPLTIKGKVELFGYALGEYGWVIIHIGSHSIDIETSCGYESLECVPLDYIDWSAMQEKYPTQYVWLDITEGFGDSWKAHHPASSSFDPERIWELNKRIVGRGRKLLSYQCFSHPDFEITQHFKLR